MSFVYNVRSTLSAVNIRHIFKKSCSCKKYLSTTATSHRIKNEDSGVHIFDRNTKHLQRERAAVATDVNLYDYLKDEIGYRLADRIFDIKRKFKLAADIGCSRGYVSKHIAPECVEELILCDSSKYNLDVAPVNESIKVRKQILDEENIQVNAHSQ